MEMGPHKDRGKLLPGWELNSRPSGWITAAPPTELQGHTGADGFVSALLLLSSIHISLIKTDHSFISMAAYFNYMEADFAIDS